MKMRLAIAMVVTALPLTAAAAQEDAPTTPNPVIVTGDAPTPPRQICRRVPAMSGSHVSRVRICKTAAEWRAMSDMSADDAQDRLEVLTVAQRGPRDGYSGGRAHGPR
jgi:hypothetical protein